MSGFPWNPTLVIFWPIICFLPQSSILKWDSQQSGLCCYFIFQWINAPNNFDNNVQFSILSQINSHLPGLFCSNLLLWYATIITVQADKCRKKNNVNILKNWFLFCAVSIRSDIHEHVALWYRLFPESPVI